MKYLTAKCSLLPRNTLLPAGTKIRTHNIRYNPTTTSSTTTAIRVRKIVPTTYDTTQPRYQTLPPPCGYENSYPQHTIAPPTTTSSALHSLTGTKNRTHNIRYNPTTTSSTTTAIRVRKIVPTTYDTTQPRYQTLPPPCGYENSYPQHTIQPNHEIKHYHRHMGTKNRTHNIQEQHRLSITGGATKSEEQQIFGQGSDRDLKTKVSRGQGRYPTSLWS